MNLLFLLFLSFYSEIDFKYYKKKYYNLIQQTNNIDKKVILYFNYHAIRYFIFRFNNGELQGLVNQYNITNFDNQEYSIYYINEFDNNNHLIFNYEYCNGRFNNLYTYIHNKYNNLDNLQLLIFKLFFVSILYSIIDDLDKLITEYKQSTIFIQYFCSITINKILLIFYENIKKINFEYYNIEDLEYRNLVNKLNNMDLYNNKFTIDFTNKETTANSFQSYFEYLENKNIKNEELTESMFEISDEEYFNKLNKINNHRLLKINNFKY